MFESIMWTYMKEEKSLLSNLIKNNNIKDSISKVKDVEAIYLVAHGSSYNASNAIAPFISKLTGIRTYVYTPSGFLNNAVSINFENTEKTWVLGISQTGTSRGVLEAVDFAHKKGFKVLGITNVKDSPMDEKSDITLYLQCGEEESNAKTKGYSSTLLLLMLLAIELACVMNVITSEKVEELYSEIKSQVNELDEVIDKTIKWCSEREYGKNMGNIYVVGNGMNFATAMEGQLKLMETRCIPTMFNDIEEFSHGMHRSLNENSYVMLLNCDVNSELMMKTYEYLKMKKINVVMISAEEEKDDCIINVTKYKNTNSIFLITSVIQAISAYVPELNGQDPNRNANNEYTDWMNTRV